MLKQYGLKLPHAVYGGENAIDHITSIIKEHGYQHVAMFTDKSIQGLGLFDIPRKAVEAAGVSYDVFNEFLGFQNFFQYISRFYIAAFEKTFKRRNKLRYLLIVVTQNDCISFFIEVFL